jgi:hypothetical protein
MTVSVYPSHTPLMHKHSAYLADKAQVLHEHHITIVIQNLELSYMNIVILQTSELAATVSLLIEVSSLPNTVYKGSGREP